MLNEIYNLINGYEINAQEVHGGLTFIDSCEAEDLTKKIITIIRDEMSFNINIGVDNYTCSACDDNLTKLTNKEMAKEFNTKELNKEWVENFYGSDWTVDTMKLTKFETEIIEELTTFLPRHMEVYDWNLPYAEMIILIIRNLLKDKKIINTLK